MIVVLAAAGDEDARAFVASAPDRACLVTPTELSLPGWVHDPAGDLTHDVLPLPGGDRLSARDIRGVLTRLGAISDVDLPWITPEDRAYVATEMTAFVRSFLARLDVPMCNRPTATSLMGQGWSEARWRVAAVRAGFELGQGPGRVVVCLGGKVLAEGARNAALLRLAASAQAELLSVRLDERERFVGVEPWPPLDDLRRPLYDHFGLTLPTQAVA